MNDQVIAHFRARFAAVYLTEVCTIQARLRVSTGYGGTTEDFSDVASGVACRVITVTNNTNDAALIADREVLADRVKILLPHDRVVDVDQRIVVGGNAYEVVNIVDDATQITHCAVIGQRVRG